MNWHYEKDGAVVGPVDDSQMEAARGRGQILPDANVWREGWTDWRRAADVWPGEGALSPEPRPPAAGLVCAECRRAYPSEELVPVGGTLVCAGCKGLAVQKLQERVSLGGGPWRDGKLVVVQKEVSLPERCIKCGQPPVKHLRRTLSWHHPAVYLAILPGLLVYLILAIVLRKQIRLQLPVCRSCNGRRVRNLWIGWVAFVGAFGLFVLVGSAPDGTYLGLAGAGLLLFSLVWAICVQFVFARKITDTHAWVGKCGAGFRDTLPPWPGS